MAASNKPPKRNSWANAAAGSPDIEESALVDTGWDPPGVIPSRGELNFEQHRYDDGMNYILQRGISAWSADETDYTAGAIVYATDGFFYQLIGTATPGMSPQTDVGGNWYLCLRPPRALPGETEADAMAIWRNDNAFMISGKDHRGFDCGRIMDFRENWTDGGAAARTVTAAKAHWFGPWSTGIDNNGGTVGTGISLPGPYTTDLTTRPWGPFVAVNAFGASVAAVSILETTRPIIKMSQASLVLECDFSINGASGPQTTSMFSLGLGDGTLAANRSLVQVPSALAHGAWIQGCTGGLANWQTVSKPNGGAATAVDTGIAIAKDAKNRYRCVVVGASDSDDSNARVIQLLNGVIVSDQTTSLTNQVLSPFVHVYASAGEVCALNVGPIRCQVRLAFGNILI